MYATPDLQPPTVVVEYMNRVAGGVGLADQQEPGGTGADIPRHPLRAAEGPHRPGGRRRGAEPALPRAAAALRHALGHGGPGLLETPPGGLGDGWTGGGGLVHADHTPI